MQTLDLDFYFFLTTIFDGQLKPNMSHRRRKISNKKVISGIFALSFQKIYQISLFMLEN